MFVLTITNFTDHFARETDAALTDIPVYLMIPNKYARILII